MSADPSPLPGPEATTQVPASAGPHRLLMVISTLGGGTGTHLVRLLDHLDQARWRASILCHDPKALTPPAHVPLIDGSASLGIFHRFPVAQWRQLRAMRRLVRTERPHLVHAYFFWPIIYARILKRIGAITHLVENREDEGFGWGALEYALLRRTADVPDRIICVSESVRRVVVEKEGAVRERAVVIRNGIDVPSRVHSEEDGSGLRAELGLKPDHLVVGMVANLNRAVKGGGYFMESLPLIAREVPRARFLVVGGGVDRDALMRQARGLGVADRLVLSGFRSDVDRFYHIMDVSVLTSLSEGLSITILESMSWGLPVVATQVGGNPELVGEGTTGFLVPPREPQAFAEAVTRLLQNPELRDAMGRAGRARAESDFSLERISDRYSNVYEEVLHGDG